MLPRASTPTVDPTTLVVEASTPSASVKHAGVSTPSSTVVPSVSVCVPTAITVSTTIMRHPPLLFQVPP